MSDPVGQVTDAEQVLSVLSGTYEQIASASVPFAFGLRDIDNVAVEDAAPAVYVVAEDGTSSGPFAATGVADATGQGGLYVTELPLEEPGFVSIVAVTEDQQRAGSAIIPVTTAESSSFPAPSQAAPAVATPTTAAPLGAAEICTASPACGMHEISLDDALAAGRPIALQFATPAYCQTAVCGPSVEILDQVRTSGEWGDIAFIHSEIYADAGQTLLDPVAQWNLPSEPWLYTIDAGGRITSRSDGALLTLPNQVDQLVRSLL